MDLETYFLPIFENMPERVPGKLTLLEIGGYAHHENLCSNILGFYFDPKNNPGTLNDLLLKSFLQAIDAYTPPFTESKNVKIKREVNTAFVVRLREQQSFLQSVMILSNEFLKSKVLFKIIYKIYTLIYNPEPSS